MSTETTSNTVTPETTPPLPNGAAKKHRANITDMANPGVTTPAQAAPTTTEAPAAPKASPPKAAAPSAPAAPKAPKASKPAKAPKKTEGGFEPGLVEVPLKDLIVVASENITRPEGIDPDSDEMKELAQNLKANGQQQPIIVTREGDKFRLAAGYRRVMALKSLRRDTATARVLLDNSINARVMANVTENENSRQEITALGRLAGYAKLQELGYSLAEIASHTGNAEDLVRDVLRLLDTKKSHPICRASLELYYSKGEGAVKEMTLQLVPGDETTEKDFGVHALPWAINRIILRKPFDEQPKLNKRAQGLTTAEFVESIKPQRDGDKGGSKGEGGKEERDIVAVDKVANKLVPTMGDAQNGLAEAREALMSNDDPAKAIKACEKALNRIANALLRQESNLKSLCGEKPVREAVKAYTEKHSDEE